MAGAGVNERGQRGSGGSRPLLVVVSSLGQAAREHFFQQVMPHYRLWLLLGGAGRSADATWQLPYVVGHTAVDTLDPAAMLEVVRELAAREPIAGILSYDEARIVATARVAIELGLPTNSPEAVYRCRDKKSSREALGAAGVAQPESIAVASLDLARQVAQQLGYPVVCKPRNLAASFGIRRADNAEELAEAYRLARETTLPEAPEHYDDGVLVEQYLEGPEISIDAACFDGQVVPLVLARKETGYPPTFEEVGHVVDPADPLLADEQLLAVLRAAHQALGVTAGITHSEFRLCADGPKVIEVNARIGGDLIPYLGLLANGVDVSLAAADIACGRSPQRGESFTGRPGRGRIAAVRHYYPDRPMIIEDVHFDESLLPAEIDCAGPNAGPGTLVSPPPGGFSFTARLAYAVAVAENETACRAALEAAGKALIVTSQEPA